MPTRNPKTILDHIVTSPLFLDADILFLYAATTGEIDVFPLAQKAFEMGKLVAFPRVRDEGIMTFHEVEHLDKLSPGFHGILEPSERAPVLEGTASSLMLVPALTYDTQGYRLGYGGGYYDRYLPHFQGVSMGILFREDLMEELPHEPHDMRLSYIATDEKMIQTRKFYGTGF